jgi:hypothetical protein
VSMLNRTFVRLLMMGVFSHVCSGVLWGMRESAVSDSGRGHWFFFWVGGIGNGKKRLRGPWSFLVSKTGDSHEWYDPNIYRCIRK